MGLRILIVEDEMTIAFMIEDMLVDLGHEVVKIAMRLPEALKAAADSDFDLALLDVNLDGHKSFPVADALTHRGVPFVFATGYGPAGIEARFKGRPVLTKPFRQADLARVLAETRPRPG